MPSSVFRLPAVVKVAVFVAASSVWLLTSCNIFSPLAADSQKDLNYHGLILRGNQAINDKDFTAAESYFSDAMAMNPKGSEAYLYRSKALVNKYKIDYNSLNDEFKLRRGNDPDITKRKKGIPFIDSNTTIAGIDSIYYPIAQSVEDLEHIIRKKSTAITLEAGFSLTPDGDTASDGVISEGVARLDLGLLEAVKAMLGPLDLDNDNHITKICGKNICPNLDATCKASTAYLSHCKEGERSEIIRFDNFKLLTKNLDINKLSSDDVRARQVSSNPNDINAFLDKMAGPVAGSNFNLDSVTGAMDQHKEAKLSSNLSEIVGNIKDLSFFLAYMRYNDGIDNDYDASSLSGVGSPMIWHDFDKDGHVRFDFNDVSTLNGYGTATNPEFYNIGHPMHRILHPDLYIKFTDSDWSSRKVAKDSSKNSRKSLMIEHCQEVVDGMIASTKPAVDETLKLKLKSEICSTTTSILKPSVTPPLRSEWIRGTFGIDEEEVDDRDNDYDGIQDEDARNSKGMDDDDDAMLDVRLIGTIPQPMVWADVAGHMNACPDIDVTKPMLDAPLSRQFCIGSLEHRLYLAQHGTGTNPQQSAKDTLKLYYSEFIGEGPNKNCLEDYDKLDPAFKAKVGLGARTESATKLIVDLACHFKHIWIRVRPANSEWTAGVLGIDEEVADGIDNDGDGWIDEDIK